MNVRLVVLLFVAVGLVGCGPIVQWHKRTETEESVIVGLGEQKFEGECKHQKQPPKHSGPVEADGT